MSALDDLLLKKYRESVASVRKCHDWTAVADPGSERQTRPNEENSLTTQSADELPSAEDVEVKTELTDKYQNPAEVAAEGHQVTEVPTLQEQTSEDETPVEPSAKESSAHGNEPEPLGESTFKAQLEVDGFLWPDICCELEAKISSSLSSAVKYVGVDYESQSIDAVIITGTQECSGRTTMTLCLARAAANQGKSVVVVDLDHKQPALMDQLGVGVDVGIESLGRHHVTGESICIKAIDDRITLVPLTTPIDSAKCLDKRVQELLALVSKHHDMVLIDASAEVAELLSNYVTKLRFGTVVVADNRVGTNFFHSEFIRRVRGENCHPIGVIENFAA